MPPKQPSDVKLHLQRLQAVHRMSAGTAQIATPGRAAQQPGVAGAPQAAYTEYELFAIPRAIATHLLQVRGVCMSATQPGACFLIV